MVRRSLMLLVICLGALLAVPVLAQADTGNIIEPQTEPESAADGWQAANCTTDTPPCSPETPAQYFKQAGGHPPIGFTQYVIRHTEEEPVTGVTTMPIEEPEIDRTIKVLRVDLPPGLTVNPQATEGQCSQAEFFNEGLTTGIFEPLCDEAATEVGEEEATLVTNENNVTVPGIGTIPFKGFVIPPTPGVNKVPVFNLTPNQGEPALFGFVIGKQEPILLHTEVSWESDFHESFRIELANTAAPPPGLTTLISRLVNVGTSGNGTFISNPTTCFNPRDPAFAHLYSTWFRAESYGEEDPNFPNGSTAVESGLPEGVEEEGCDEVPFDPTIAVTPGTNLVDSPSPTTVTTNVPFENPAKGGSEIAQSQLRSAEVTLPAGMGLNPSGSVGLLACTDAQFHKGERVGGNSCPEASKIGTVEIETPPLPPESLKGNIYVGEQKSSEPTSGEEFRILVEAKSERYGIVVRLLGHTRANAQTGQLTTVFDEQEVGPLAGTLPAGLPQVPFESVRLKFDSAKPVISSPPTCGPQLATSEMVPWSDPANSRSPGSEFGLSGEPGGAPCPATLAARKFAPSYTAKTDSAKAGSYSPFRVDIGRSDGQQELKLVNVTLPKGLTGKLAGIPYCSEQAFAAAASRGGGEEQRSPSCPAASQIGTTTTVAGTGPAPLSLPGKVYLAGPYKGAPISLGVITPAVSGPFDLGNVVVRVALNVDPLTAQVNAVSDVIPDVFGGVKLDLRTISFNIDREKFMLNPTNCAAQATAGTINGGGSNPANPAAFSSYAVSAPFQASGCNKLAFKPKLHTRLYGPVKRNKFPRLRAILEARGGDANVLRTALTLPHSLFLEQGHIRTVCTRPDLAAHACPSASVYGHAEAITPLLSKKLSGPVYLVPSGHTLPDLVADLRGQVEIQLHGVISSKHGGLKTVFNNVPDVPVTKFILNMQGGQKSLLVNSTNTCKDKQLAVLNLKGQNGKKVLNNRYRLNISSCKKK